MSANQVTQTELVDSLEEMLAAVYALCWICKGVIQDKEIDRAAPEEKILRAHAAIEKARGQA